MIVASCDRQTVVRTASAPGGTLTDWGCSARFEIKAPDTLTAVFRVVFLCKLLVYATLVSFEGPAAQEQH
jgi:hypothetical protein